MISAVAGRSGNALAARCEIAFDLHVAPQSPEARSGIFQLLECLQVLRGRVVQLRGQLIGELEDVFRQLPQTLLLMGIHQMPRGSSAACARVK